MLVPQTYSRLIFEIGIVYGSFCWFALFIQLYYYVIIFYHRSHSPLIITLAFPYSCRHYDIFYLCSDANIIMFMYLQFPVIESFPTLFLPCTTSQYTTFPNLSARKVKKEVITKIKYALINFCWKPRLISELMYKFS